MSSRKKGFVMEDEDVVLDISSLIDVCFLLLIYFLVTSTIQPREQDLPLTLPSNGGTSDKQLPIAPMLISVTKAGSGFAITVNKTEPLDNEVVGERRALPKLTESLIAYNNMAKSSESEPLVQLFIEPDVDQQTAMDVLNCLKLADINSVTFAIVDK